MAASSARWPTSSPPTASGSPVWQVGPPASFVTDADRDLSPSQTGWPALLERWKSWAADLTDEQTRRPSPTIDLKGRLWTQPLWQLVLHVVNHGTHHRGQVAGFLRSLGHTPPHTDLIHFLSRTVTKTAN